MYLKKAIQEDYELHRSILDEMAETYQNFSPHSFHGLSQIQLMGGEWLRDCYLEEWLNDQSKSED
jgi:hypothetical protein